MATVASHSDIAQFVPDYSAQFLGELQGILEKAQRFSGASGVAIAFVEGDELVTKSGLGASAPEVGSRSAIQGSFTGLCVQTREVQRCDDASCDSRVDSQACAALGVASMVIVPIGDKHKCLGVLAAFAAKPNSFSPTHVALLRTLADIVVELYNRYPGSQPTATAMNAVAAPTPKPEPPAPVAKAEPAASKPEPIGPVASTPAPRITVPVAPHVESAPRAIEPPKPKPAAASQTAIRLTEGPVIVPPVTPDPKPEPKHVARPVSVNQEPLRIERKTETPRFAPVIDIGAGREKREEVLSSAADIGPVTVAKPAPEAPLFSSYGYSAIGALEQQQKEESGSKRVLMIAAGLIIVIALAASGYLFSHRSKSTTEAANVSQAVQPLPVEPAPASSVPVPQTTPAASDVAVPPASTEKAPEPSAKTTQPAPAREKNSEPAPRKSAPAPLLVADGGTVPKRPVTENVEAPGVVSTGTGDVGSILGMVKTAQPKANFKASSVTPPELMRRVAPVYPSFAKQLRLKSERVVLTASIGKDGTVTDVKLVRGKPMFVDAAISAVRQWKYKPAYLNGEPVTATVEIDLDFTN